MIAAGDVIHSSRETISGVVQFRTTQHEERVRVILRELFPLLIPNIVCGTLGTFLTVTARIRDMGKGA